MTAAGPERPERDPVAWLLEASHTWPPAELDEAVLRALTLLGARWALPYLVDHDQRALHPFGRHAADEQSLAVDGTLGGEVFALERTRLAPSADGRGVDLWVPLIDGTARLGVLRTTLPSAPDDDLVAAVERVASLTSELVVSKDQYTDALEQARRHRPMSLEAELQRCTLPPVALVTPDVAVAGILLPAYEVAGDSFDYALGPEGLDVAVIDSVGHQLTSSLISHLVQGSLRNSRRNGIGLVDAYAAADEAVARAFPDMQFATAAFGRLDLRSNRFRWVSAGHPPPLVLRRGEVVGEAPTTPVRPIGVGASRAVVNEVTVGPGDGVVLYTDGVTEGGVRGGERFGLDRFTTLLGEALNAALPPAEVLRRLVSAVLQHSAYELHDDTSVLLVQRPGPEAG